MNFIVLYLILSGITFIGCFIGCGIVNKQSLIKVNKPVFDNEDFGGLLFALLMASICWPLTILMCFLVFILYPIILKLWKFVSEPTKTEIS